MDRLSRVAWGCVWGLGMGVAALNMGNTGCQSAPLPAPAEESFDDSSEQDSSGQGPGFVGGGNQNGSGGSFPSGGGGGNDASCDALLAQMEPLVGVPDPGLQCVFGNLMLQYIDSGCDETGLHDRQTVADVRDYMCKLAAELEAASAK
jgi:hypothetical protein